MTVRVEVRLAPDDVAEAVGRVVSFEEICEVDDDLGCFKLHRWFDEMSWRLVGVFDLESALSGGLRDGAVEIDLSSARADIVGYLAALKEALDG